MARLKPMCVLPSEGGAPPKQPFPGQVLWHWMWGSPEGCVGDGGVEWSELSELAWTLSLAVSWCCELHLYLLR